MEMEKAIHFGVRVQSAKYGLRLTREKYAIINQRASLPKFKSLEERGAYTDVTGRFYTQEWCESYQEVILKNFDLSMEHFSKIDAEEFNDAIERFLKKNKKFEKVIDLKEWNGPGYYLMVLDDYKQAYIGTAQSIRRRIQQHWATTKEFDRLLFPMYAVEKSIMSIDVFRALDTTRIYAYRTGRTYISENRFIKDFPPDFLCNRIGGGLGDKNAPRILGSVDRALAERENVRNMSHDE